MYLVAPVSAVGNERRPPKCFASSWRQHRQARRTAACRPCRIHVAAHRVAVLGCISTHGASHSRSDAGPSGGPYGLRSRSTRRRSATTSHSTRPRDRSTRKAILAKLNELGEFVKSASSTVEAPVARRLRESFPAAPPPKAPAKKAPAKKAEPAQAAPVEAAPVVVEPAPP